MKERAAESDPSEGSWKENAKWVADTLRSQNAQLNRIEVKVDKQNTRIAVLEVKAGFWGALAGAMAGIAGALFHGGAK